MNALLLKYFPMIFYSMLQSSRQHGFLGYYEATDWFQIVESILIAKKYVHLNIMIIDAHLTQKMFIDIKLQV